MNNVLNWLPLDWFHWFFHCNENVIQMALIMIWFDNKNYPCDNSNHKSYYYYFWCLWFSYSVWRTWRTNKKKIWNLIREFIDFWANNTNHTSACHCFTCFALLVCLYIVFISSHLQSSHLHIVFSSSSHHLNNTMLCLNNTILCLGMSIPYWHLHLNFHVSKINYNGFSIWKDVISIITYHK